MKDKYRTETRYKIGKHRKWLKTLTIKLPTIKKQQGVSSAIIVRTERGFRNLQVPNYIGIKKVTFYFDYSQHFYSD